MGKKKLEIEEQLDLIDVAPENEKEIIACAKRYKKFQRERSEALKNEVAEKQKLLNLIEAAELSRLDDGSIKFKVDGFMITVTPRDELIRVKDEGEENEES